MTHIIIFAGIFSLMLAFVAAAEKGCDWYWGRKRRIATAPAGLRNDGKEAKKRGAK